MSRPFRSLTLLMALASSIAMTPIPSLAQTAPILRKNWKVIATVTAIGAPNPLHPLHKSNTGTANPPTTWNTLQENCTAQILKQQGRHVELVLTSPRGYRRMMIGTLSADGKQLQIVDGTRDMTVAVERDKMSGCGSVRGGDGSFEHFTNNYAAVCWDFTAVK